MFTVVYKEKVYCQTFDSAEIGPVFEDLVKGGAAEEEIFVFMK